MKVQSKSRQQAQFLRLAYSAPPPRESLVEEIHRFTLPATKSLPFVKLRPNDQPFLQPECYWHVQSTGKRQGDIIRGRAYARDAIAAMRSDRNMHLIAYIIQDMFKDATTRRGKKGRGSASFAMRGFLAEISEAVAAAP